MKLPRLLTLLSVWPQSYQKTVKAASAALSFPFIGIHYQRIDTLPPKTNPSKPWRRGSELEGGRKRLRLTQEWIASHFKSSHYVLKSEWSSVFLYDKTTREMYCKIIRSKQAGKMSDALLHFLSQSCSSHLASCSCVCGESGGGDQPYLCLSSWLHPAQEHDGQSYLLQKRDRTLHPPLALWLPALFIPKSKRESHMCRVGTLAAVPETKLMVGQRRQKPSVGWFWGESHCHGVPRLHNFPDC